MDEESYSCSASRITLSKLRDDIPANAHVHMTYGSRVNLDKIKILASEVPKTKRYRVFKF